MLLLKPALANLLVSAWGVFPRSQIWSQVSSLPTLFNETYDHSLLTKLLGNTPLVRLV